MRVLAVLALFAVVAMCQPAKPGRVEGRATDVDGIPIAGASVSLIAPVEGRLVASVQSEFKGSYAIDNVLPGTYVVLASKGGYAAAYYSGARGVTDPAQIVVESGSVLKSIDFQLERDSGIAGTVLDHGGDAVSNAFVQAYRLFLDGPNRSVTPAGAAFADSAGRYFIHGLAPDTYFVAASPPSVPKQAQVPGKAQPCNVTTYYPSAADLSSASPIRIRPSEPAIGIDIRMRVVAAISIAGSVTPAQAGLRAHLWRADEPLGKFPVRQTTVSPNDGTFEFDAVTPGKYWLYVFDAKESKYARATVGAGDEDISQMRLALNPSRDITGRLTILEPGRELPLGGVEVFLNPVNMPSPGRQFFARSDPSGGFRIAEVPPGKYTVYVPRVPEKSVVREVRFGQEAAGAGFEVEVAEGENRSLSIGISTNAGSLSGIVANAEGAPVARAVAVTVSDTPGGPAFREITNDRGEFLERNLPTGRFKVYAFPIFDVRLLANSRALSKLEPYAQHVTIAEGQRAMTKLKIVPDSAMR